MDKISIATEALKKIRDTQGAVCSMYEICTHPSCQSSYNSWAIADEALCHLSEASTRPDDTDAESEESELYDSNAYGGEWGDK